MVRKTKYLQTLYLLIINILILKPLALPLADKQTFASSFAKFRLRIKSFLVAFTNQKPLYFKYLAITRLHHRLQICQLNALTSLQPCLQIIIFKNDNRNKKYQSVL
jgi:hypothetical protein